MGVLPPEAQVPAQPQAQPQAALPQAPGGMPAAPGGGAIPMAPVNETPEGGNHGYNGVVEHDGQKVAVKNGMAQFDGQLYFVSDDGAFVVDQEHHIVGRVVNGQFVPLDDQYLAELQAKGMVEGGS